MTDTLPLREQIARLIEETKTANEKAAKEWREGDFAKGLGAITAYERVLALLPPLPDVEALITQLYRQPGYSGTINAAATALRTLQERCKELEAALKEGRRAIGDHWAPNDCYATGPMTGDAIRDLVQCPACSFIALHDAALKEPTND